MAVKRTQKERKEIAMRCVEIEKEGGDVLGYLRSENYISPRATWINLQREILKRPQSKITSGKPKKGEKKMDEKSLDARLKRLESLKEQIIDGVGIRAALSSMGYTGKSAGQAYRQMKNLAKAHDPDFYARMPEKISDEDAPVSMPDKPTVKVDGPIRIETPEAGKVEVVETPETCVRVTPESIFIGKAPRPVEFAGLEVTAVKDPVLGEFYHDQKYGCIDWRTPEGDEVSMPVAAWRKLIDRLPDVLGVIGVNV